MLTYLSQRTKYKSEVCPVAFSLISKNSRDVSNDYVLRYFADKRVLSLPECRLLRKKQLAVVCPALRA